MALLGGYGGVARPRLVSHEGRRFGDFFLFLANLFFRARPSHRQTNTTRPFTAMAGARNGSFGLMDIEPDWKDAATAKPLPNIHGRVEFQSVHFAYQPGRAVVENISFTVEPGQTVAPRRPYRQRENDHRCVAAKISSANARPRCWWTDMILSMSPSASLHEQMGSVQQNNFLFAGSVADNIRLARPNATEQDVRAALQSLDCLDLIENLADGLKTDVGEKKLETLFARPAAACVFRPCACLPTRAFLSSTKPRAQLIRSLKRASCKKRARNSPARPHVSRYRPSFEHDSQGGFGSRS